MSNSPIYSKLNDQDDSSNQSFDRRLPPPRPVPGYLVGTNRVDLPHHHSGRPQQQLRLSPDHIPRLHERHPYWSVEHIRQNHVPGGGSRDGSRGGSRNASPSHGSHGSSRRPPDELHSDCGGPMRDMATNTDVMSNSKCRLPCLND